MKRNISRLFTAPATYLRRKQLEDPFTYARGLTALLYLSLVFVIISATNVILDGVISDIIASALTNPGAVSAEHITQEIARARFITRSINIVVYSVLVYLLLGLTLRPIKGVMESQKRFIANVSHELRTPLAVAKAEIEVALRKPDELTHEESLTLLSGMLRRVDQMSRTIQFFLLLSDFNTRHSYSSEKLVSLPERMRAVQDFVSETAKKAEIRVDLDIRDEVQIEHGNRTALEKMILNLVKNAITHSPAGSVVTISLERVGGKVTLAVTDTGEGIPEAEQAGIFEPFVRGSNAKPGGTGVGLSIVREVARIHGGKVALQSRPGEGSRFEITFSEIAG